jgi:dinuclear metal center YbgI/SA1388 family protein
MSGIELPEVCEYLDDYLRLSEVPDFPGAVNGLQVEGPARVTKVGAAVDACEASIVAAARAGVELLLVHHGLLWGSPFPLTGARYRRFSTLVESGIAVYSAHLPLDVHPEVGNNPILARRLGLEGPRGFAEHDGLAIGLHGRWEGGREALARRIEEILGHAPRVFPFGGERLERVGILTGSGGSTVAEAARLGLDAFVTGEATHASLFEAEESGMNLFLAGHYATETVGVRALAEHVADRFGLEWTFLDHPTGL